LNCRPLAPQADALRFPLSSMISHKVPSMQCFQGCQRCLTRNQFPPLTLISYLGSPQFPPQSLLLHHGSESHATGRLDPTSKDLHPRALRQVRRGRAPCCTSRSRQPLTYTLPTDEPQPSAEQIGGFAPSVLKLAQLI
jgi:hypothetical protein